MTWNSAAQAHLAADLPRVVRCLLWGVVQPIAGGSPLGLGYWTGADDQTLVVGGVSRLYYGAQGGLAFDPFVTQIGTDIQHYTVHLGLSAEGRALIRDYHLGGASAEVHQALYDARDMTLLDIRRRVKGQISHAQEPGGDMGAGDSVVLPLTIVASDRRGTMTTPVYKNSVSQAEVDPSDTFYAHGNLRRAEVYSMPWGKSA